MRPTAYATILTTLLLAITGGCGNRASEFDNVLSETIIEGEFYSDQQPKQEEPHREVVRQVKAGPRNHDRIRLNNIGNLRELFNDSNHVQLQYARRLGIDPITDIRGLYRTRRPLVKVETNEYYKIDTLTHSFPYLVPEAAALLKTIGANFIDSLSARGADGYKIIVTSLLRTHGSVKRLRRVNVNASDSSTHQFATTFDITYNRFECADTTRTIHEGDLKNLLAEVLNDLRCEGRCLVKFERKTPCFHITVTR